MAPGFRLAREQLVWVGRHRSFAQGGAAPSSRADRRCVYCRYSCPKYAVNRPAMTTQAHNRQEATPNLMPREETVPAASQAAASRLMVRWKYTITIAEMITNENFTSNMPSAIYRSGFVSHSVKPLTAWRAKGIQMSGINRFNEV